MRASLLHIPAGIINTSILGLAVVVDGIDGSHEFVCELEDPRQRGSAISHTAVASQQSSCATVVNYVLHNSVPSFD